MNNIDPEQLLNLVKQRRPLYDFNMKEYSCKAIVDTLWGEVAVELNTTVAECKAKWTCLRSSYARSRREIRRLSSLGQNALKRKKVWYLADAMSFLSEFMNQHKKTDSNSLDDNYMESSTEEFQYDNEEMYHETEDSTHSGENNDEYVQQCEMSILNSNSSRKLSSKLQSSLSNNDNKIAEPMIEIIEPTSDKNESSDPDVLFFRSIIPDLKKLSSRNKRKFKETILCSLNNVLDQEEDECHISINQMSSGLKSTVKDEN